MNIEEYIAEQSAGFFEYLQEWLRIPSVSADPARQQDMHQSAQWLADCLRQCGFPVVEIWPTGAPDDSGQPAVFAEWPAAAPDAPTVLIYGHHDVQPGEPREEWLLAAFSLPCGVSHDCGEPQRAEAGRYCGTRRLTYRRSPASSQ